MKLEYKVKAGSHMYGTSVPTSDIDYRGFYMPSRDDIYGLFPSSESKVVNTNGQDEAFWEFRHYIKMCLSANPNVIETLFAPEDCVVEASKVAKYFRQVRNIFLSKAIGRTYLGYATVNYKRCLDRMTQDELAYDGKDAMHLIRLIRTGNECLRTGNLEVRRTEDKAHFMAIRNRQIPWKDIAAEFEATKKTWKSQMENSVLPDEPPKDSINNVVMDCVEDCL